MIEISITGADQMQRNLRRVRRNLAADLDRALARAASPFGLRRYVPVRTGRLRFSVRSRRVRLGHQQVSIGSRRAYYPHLVKFRNVASMTANFRGRRQFENLVLFRLERELRRVKVRL